ncbi:MAG: hypothetical protein WCL07_03860 [bacterium]
MKNNIFEFIFSTFHSTFEFMSSNLSNYQEFSRSLSKQIQVKEGGNIQYSFDVELDRIIKNKIKEFNISGKIFSEESGFFEFGNNEYRVVYDPFCNSSLASKTFHEAAVGISIFGYDYGFITSAIMDYQTGIVAIVEGDKTNYYQIQTSEKIVFDNPAHDDLENSWVVATLESQEERKGLNKLNEILQKSKRIIISSGHIYWLKLAIGFVDAYLDPIGGEALYEMFAAAVAQKAGCVVTDLSGKPFDATDNLKEFENNRNFTYYPVAARTLKLHTELLRSLS